MKNRNKMLIIMFFVSVFLSACGAESINQNTTTIAENEGTYQNNGKEENNSIDNVEIENEAEFQADYVEGEQNTVMLSGPVIGQGKWVYFFTSDEILKIDENENVYTIVPISNVNSISVLGDWIYYSTANEIGRVRTDGTNQEVLKEAKVVYPFLVDGNDIYYFEQYKVSASKVNYQFHCYDVEEKIDRYNRDDGVGNDGSEYGGRILGKYKDRLYVCADEEEESLVLYIYTDTLDTHSDDDESTVLMIDGLEGGFIYEDQLLYSNSSGWNNGVTDIYVVNLEDGTLDFNTQFEFGKDSSQFLSYGQPTRLCGACNLSGKEYWVMWVDFSAIYLVPVEDAKLTLPEQLPTIKIVEEDKTKMSIFDSLVVGDYVYYFGNTNGITHLYRIGFDGDNWKQLY